MRKKKKERSFKYYALRGEDVSQYDIFISESYAGKNYPFTNITNNLEITNAIASSAIAEAMS